MRTIDDRDIIINQGSTRRALGPSIIKLVLIVLILALGLACFLALRDALDPLARAEREAAQWRAQDIDRDLYQIDVIAGALIRLALPVALAVAALGAVGVGLRLVYIRWASVLAVQAHYSVKMVEAQRQAAPHTLTYSPHISGGNSRADLPAPHEGTHAALLSGAPTFAELLSSGKVGAGNPLMLGTDIDTGEALTGSWLDLYSTAIGGLPGTGKTTSQRFLACQTALHGAGFVIVDPHAGAGEDSLAETLAPLAPAFLCEPASDDKGILQAVRLVADIGRKRVSGDRDRKPIVLWLDETTALLSRSSVAGPLAELLEQIAQEYRKVAIFAACSGQIWTASRTGDDSALRDSFASVWAHRMKRSQARLLLPTGEAERVERLEKGQALIWRTSGATNIIEVPNTVAADVVNVARLLKSNTNPVEPVGSPLDTYGIPLWSADGRHLDSKSKTESKASERLEVPTALDARILALFRGGMDAAEIVRQLWPDAKPGRAMQERSAEVQAAIRRSVQG